MGAVQVEVQLISPCYASMRQCSHISGDSRLDLVSWASVMSETSTSGLLHKKLCMLFTAEATIMIAWDETRHARDVIMHMGMLMVCCRMKEIFRSYMALVNSSATGYRAFDRDCKQRIISEIANAM